MDGTVKLGFDPEGALISVSGLLSALAVEADATALWASTVDDAETAFLIQLDVRKEEALDALLASDEWTAEAEERVLRYHDVPLGMTTARVYNDAFGGFTWRIETGDGLIAYLDDALVLTKLATSAVGDEWTVRIHHEDYNPSPHIDDDVDDVDGSPNSTDIKADYAYEPWNGRYVFELTGDHPSAHPLGPVSMQTATSPYPYTTSLPNSTSSYAVSFVSPTNSLNYPQQSTYYWMRKIRNYAASNIWSGVTPGFTTGVSEVILDSTTPWCPPTAGACYTATYRTINFTPTNTPAVPPKAGLIWHEFGHYISDTYGDFPLWTCNPGVNEGAAINEAVSDSYSMILGSRFLDADYFNEWEKRLPSDPHRTYGGLVSQSTQCTNIYPYGNAWRQAFWEVLNGHGCRETRSRYKCTTGAGGEAYGSYIGWASPAVARLALSRALAYATKYSGGNVTFTTFLGFMDSWLQANGYASEAANVMTVFAHHGI